MPTDERFDATLRRLRDGALLDANGLAASLSLVEPCTQQRVGVVAKGARFAHESLMEGGNRGPFPFHFGAAGAATQPPCAQDQHASVIEKPIRAIIDVALLDHVSEAAEVGARFLMSTDDSPPDPIRVSV